MKDGSFNRHIPIGVAAFLFLILPSVGVSAEKIKGDLFQYGDGNTNVFAGTASDAISFDGEKVVVTDIIINQGSQSGPLGKIVFILDDYDASTALFRTKFSYSFDSTSEQLHFTAGIICENKIRLYNHGVSANEFSYTVLGYYIE